MVGETNDGLCFSPLQKQKHQPKFFYTLKKLRGEKTKQKKQKQKLQIKKIEQLERRVRD